MNEATVQQVGSSRLSEDSDHLASTTDVSATNEEATNEVIVDTKSGHVCCDRETLVGGLSSAIVHMLLVIVLGLLFAQVRQQVAPEIQLAVANTSASDAIETLSFEPPEIAEASTSVETTTVAPNLTELEIKEPSLITEFNDAAVTQSFDAAARLSDAVEMPGGNASDQKSDQRGSFFGADAYGDRFVYVVDMSTSMGYRSEYGQTRFRVACRELLRSIKALNPSQEFCVVMFCYRTRVMFDSTPRMIAATDQNKQRVAQWVSTLGLGAGTDPRYGTMMALKLKPDAIFLLSDGEFNGQDVNTHAIPGNVPIETIIKRYRKDAVPLHTIAFEDTLNRPRLRRIATATHGTHRFVGNVSDQNLLLMDLRSRNLNDVAYGMQCLIDQSSKVRDDRTLKAVAGLIGRRFVSSNANMRERAHQAMLTIANGENLGPFGDKPSKAQFKVAQKAWSDYWEMYFREKRNTREDGGVRKADNDVVLLEL